MSVYKNDPTATIFLLADRLLQKGYVDEEKNYGGTTFHTFTKNGKSWITNGFKISYPFNTRAICDISNNKAIGYDLASEYGASIPETIVLKPDMDIKNINLLLEKYNSIIVKPLDASLSLGVTMNISADPEINPAIELARKYSDIVLAQQQVVGDELRFAIINGKAVAALHRQTARVIGDGVSSVQELIKIENAERALLENAYFTYPQLDETLINATHLKDKTVLEAGKTLELSHSAMVRYGASMFNVLPDVHEGYVKIAEQIGSALSMDFIVVDIMIADYTTPSTSENYWFMEYNTSPILKLFHGTRDGNNVDIVGLVADRIDRAIQSN